MALQIVGHRISPWHFQIKVLRKQVLRMSVPNGSEAKVHVILASGICLLSTHPLLSSVSKEDSCLIGYLMTPWEGRSPWPPCTRAPVWTRPFGTYKWVTIRNTQLQYLEFGCQFRFYISFLSFFYLSHDNAINNVIYKESYEENCIGSTDVEDNSFKYYKNAPLNHSILYIILHFKTTWTFVLTLFCKELRW